MRKKFINFVVGICLGTLSTTSFAGQKIINGEPANINDFPFFSALNTDVDNISTHRCGATLIANKWVLTAAHCVKSLTGDLSVLIGLAQYSPEPKYTEITTVEEIYIHPQFSSEPVKYDIALLKLDKEITDVPLAKLNGIDETVNLPVGTTMSVIGFGQTALENTAPVLMKTNVTVFPDSACIDTPEGYPPTLYDSAHHICAGNPAGGTNTGDSGGPLMVRNEIGEYIVSGIVSRRLILPAEQYTRISFYSEWIKNTMQENR